jgi:hypothetical protein
LISKGIDPYQTISGPIEKELQVVILFESLILILYKYYSKRSVKKYTRNIRIVSGDYKAEFRKESKLNIPNLAFRYLYLLLSKTRRIALDDQIKSNRISEIKGRTNSNSIFGFLRSKQQIDFSDTEFKETTNKQKINQ